MTTLLNRQKFMGLLKYIIELKKSHMKVFPLVVLLTTSTFLYGYRENKKAIIIHGVIARTHDPISYIYLTCLGGKSLNGDSIKVINNKYTCIIKTDYVAFITFYARPFSDPASFENKNHFVIMAEPGNCSIVSVDSFSNIRVTGSRAFIEYRNLKKSQLNKTLEIQRLQNQTDSLKNVGNTPDSVLLRLDRQITNLFLEKDRIYLDYAKSFPSSLITPFVLSLYFNHVSDAEVNQNSDIYNSLPKAGKTSDFGRDIKSRIEAARIGIGITAPQFIQGDTAGKMISLESLRGKYVLLDFWASWCIPCRAENTHLTKAFKDYHNKGFTIISISLDNSDAKDKWLKAINTDGLTWFNISDLKGFENEVAKLYHITAIPQNFLINPEGKIIGKNLRNGDLEIKLNKIFEIDKP